MDDVWAQWERWERLLAGEAVDAHDVAHILEEPTEYQLRRLLRTAPERDELYDRFATWLFAPAEPLEEDVVTELARQCRDELHRLSLDHELRPDVPTGELPVVVGKPDISPSVALPGDQVLEAAFDHARGLRSHAIGHPLWQIARAKGAGPAVALHLCGPLATPRIDLPAHFALARTGHRVWIDTDAIRVAHEPVAGFHLHERSPGIGWEMTWPTEAEIAQHLADERAVMSPSTPTAELHRLADSNSPFVRPRLAAHQNMDAALADRLVDDINPRVRGTLAGNPAAPPPILARLAQDTDAWVRSRAASNPSTPPDALATDGDEAHREDPQVLRSLVTRPDAAPELLARALGHPDSQVRQALAERSDLSLPAIEQLARDPEVYVRSKIADNPLTPEHVLAQLRNDEHRLVRRRAER